MCVCILTMREACSWYNWREKNGGSLEGSSRGSNQDDLSFWCTTDYSVIGLIQQEEWLDVLTGYLFLFNSFSFKTEASLITQHVFCM